MKSIHAVFVFLLGLIVAMPAMALQDMSDAALAQATGQDGIAMQIDFHLNTGNDGMPLSTLGVNGGAGCSSPMQSATLASAANPCKIAIQASRPNNPNLWLVFKDLYGFLSIPNLMIDEQNNPTTASPYADPSRFEDANGNCLISTGCGGQLAQGLPSMELHFHPNGTTAGDCTAAATSCDINLFLNVGRISMEFGPTGYNNDNNGSFMGLKISDLSGPNAPARMNFDGQVRIYGF